MKTSPTLNTDKDSHQKYHLYLWNKQRRDEYVRFFIPKIPSSSRRIQQATMVYDYEQDKSSPEILTGIKQFEKKGSVRTPMLIQGRHEHTETNLMHFK